MYFSGSPALKSVDIKDELILLDLKGDKLNAEIFMRKPKWDSYFDKNDDNGYFDDWFSWIKPSNKKQPSLQQRIQTLELRQKILFDLIRCEALDEEDCSYLLARAEVLFKIPPKKKGTKKPKKKQPPQNDDIVEDDPEEPSSAPDDADKPPQQDTRTTTTQRNEGSTNTIPEPTTEPTSPSTQPPSTASTEPTTTVDNADIE